MPLEGPSDYQQVLRRVLRQARELAGVSQEDMARAMSLRQSDISKIERGVRNLDVVELRLWAQAVGVTLEAFASVLDEEWAQLESLRHQLATPRH